MSADGETRPSAMVVTTGGYERGRYNAWGSQPKAHGVEVGVVETRLIDLAERFAAPIFYQEGEHDVAFGRWSVVAVLLVAPGAGPISICAEPTGSAPILPDEMDRIVSTRGSFALVIRQEADLELVRSFLRDRLPASAKLSLYKDYERGVGA